MSQLNAYVVAGTVVQWGGYVKRNGISTSPELLTDALRAHLGPSFRNFSVIEMGGFFNTYFSITASCAVDRAQLAHVLYDIEAAIRMAGFEPETQAFWVYWTPATTRTDAAVATAGQSDVRPPAAAPTASKPGGFSICGDGYKWSVTDWTCVPDNAIAQPSFASSSLNVIDDLANYLGVTPTQAAIVGGLGVLVVLVTIKKVL